MKVPMASRFGTIVVGAERGLARRRRDGAVGRRADRAAAGTRLNLNHGELCSRGASVELCSRAMLNGEFCYRDASFARGEGRAAR